MITTYKKFIANKDTNSIWRKAKQLEFTGTGAIKKIIRYLTHSFGELTTRNSMTLRYIGFILNKSSNKLELTDAGRAFIYARNKQKILDQQLMKIYLNCDEINSRIKIKIIPLEAILLILKDIKKITLQEYILFVCWINKESDIQKTVNFIKYYRKHKNEQANFNSALEEKVHKLAISDFKDNIKRFYDMLLLASFLKKSNDNSLQASISNKDIDHIIANIDHTKLTKNNYYTYLTSRPSTKDSKAYQDILNQLKDVSGEEKEQIVDGIYGRKPLPNMDSVTPTEISLNIAQTLRKKGVGGRKKTAKKIDYILKNTENKRYGDRAEEIIVKHEKKYLEINNKKTLALKVERVSLKDDSLGYDVLSFDSSGTKKHIEVKGVKGKTSKSFSFFISSNEINVAKNDTFYHLYIVFECGSTMPKVFCMPNPFTNIIPGVSITSHIPGVGIYPVKYMVTVNLT
jgi:hypothetical protein